MNVFSLAAWFLISFSARAELVRNSLGMNLVKIPSGTFQMGSLPGEKGHQADEVEIEVILFSFLVPVVRFCQRFGGFVIWSTVVRAAACAQKPPVIISDQYFM